MSVKSISDVQKQAYILINSTPNYRHFATTRIIQARPKDPSAFGKMMAVPIESDRLTLYAFETADARDKFVSELGASPLDVSKRGG